MQYLQTLSAKAETWARKYGIVAKNLAKISLKTLIPGAGEFLAEGIDCVFEIVEHQDDLKWKERLDEQLQVIQADQERYVQLLETIENSIGTLLSEISKEFHQSLSQMPNAQATNLQEQQLKNLFDRVFSQNETQFIQLQKSLLESARNFKIADQKLDELCKKQIEIAIELKAGNQSLTDSLDALKQLYQHLSLQIQDQQQAHTRNQAFRDFLVEIEHELLHHNLSRARVILENALIQKTIDLQFKQLYECKINALQGHLKQIEELLEKSQELASLKGVSNIKQQVKNASKWLMPHQEYRTFLHQSGKMIGDKGWTLDVPIGIGGMGEVWKAHNLKGEMGAIKFVHEELLMDQFAKKKFFDEIDSLNQLQHPNIVRLKDWGIENGTHQLYLVMAYVEGETLRQMINRKAYFTWQEAQGVFRDLVEALYHCHQLNIIHKDIKPDNIILNQKTKNQPILIDFGIAKIKKVASSGTIRTSATGMIFGTELYMSPEQKSGGHLDGKSDIYSLGVTLLESLTGKCAVDGKLNLNDEILDLVDDCLTTWRKRYDAEQLFEKLGGDLEKLKKGQSRDARGEEIEKEINRLKQDVQKAQKELIQANMHYQSLMNEKNTIENHLKQNQTRFEGKILDFEKSIQEKEKLIQKLEGEKKVLGDELEKLKKLNQDQNQQIKTMQVELELLKGQVSSSKVNVQPVQPIVVNQPPTILQTNGLGNMAGDVKKVSARGIGFNMVYCPDGEFWMGIDDPSLKDDYWNRSKPRHNVRMNKGMWIGETQVTQELWKAVMGWNPNGFKRSLNLPVESVNWYDCLVFCNKLSELEGFTPCFTLKNINKDGNQITQAIVERHRNANGYRLPTEAEWEYCAKAGTELTYSGSKNLDEVAWYDKNSGYETHEVKTKKANEWGLYDMSGNVWEWCMDQWDENAYKNRTNGNIENPISWSNGHCARVVRGGSCGYNIDFCRVASRYWFDADYRYDYQGFRVLRCEP